MPNLSEDTKASMPLGYYDRPVLVVDTGRHTSGIQSADVDANGLFAVTASLDKTVRVWALNDGALKRTIRLPAGPGDVGKAYAVAIDPCGLIVAVGGLTAPARPENIYLYDIATGNLLHRISGLPDITVGLSFSRDGRFLAAVLGRGGLRVYDCDHEWAEMARDEDYSRAGYCPAFAADGRLATTSVDGLIRLYTADFALPPMRQSAPGGRFPVSIAFSPDDTRLAVGYTSSTRVDVLDSVSLGFLHAANTEYVDNGDLCAVAWAPDGTLLAGGCYEDETGANPVLTWALEGRTEPRTLSAGRSTVYALRPLPNGDVLVATADAFLARLCLDGQAAWTLPPLLADFRGKESTLSVSSDGGIVGFGFDDNGTQLAAFDLARLSLMVRPEAVAAIVTPVQGGLSIELGPDGIGVTLNGLPLPLPYHEQVFSFAVQPDGSRFVLGTHFNIRTFDAAGKELWRVDAPGPAWAVNGTGDGRFLIAAYGDGTIRWHRLADGSEILSFMPISDRKNWIVWTPEGFYAAGPGAHGILRWHVNQRDWQPASDYAVSDIPGFYRPEAAKLVVREGETARAIGLAIMAEQREKVRLRTNSRLPPGAKLHLLAVGISCYDQKHLKLDFAQQDAHDLVSAFSSTQDALYVSGSRQYLADCDATNTSIRRGLETLLSAMTGKDDLAIVHFSGHGALVDDEFYLLPCEVNAGDSVTLKATALPISAIRAELKRMAARGRVLLLLDACCSGSALLDGRAAEVSSQLISTSLVNPNISVLASSSSSQASREDPAWRNGALTEAVLEALGAADMNHDGLISATELTGYVDSRVRNLTNGAQQPAMEIRFNGTLFAAR